MTSTSLDKRWGVRSHRGRRRAPRERSACAGSGERSRLHPAESLAGAPTGRRSRASAKRRSDPRGLDLDRVAGEEGRHSLLGGGLVEGGDVGLRQIVELREVGVELLASLRQVLLEKIARRLVVAGERLV